MDSLTDDFLGSWSPDGERIVFSSLGEIYVMDADGGNQHRLTQNDQNDVKDYAPSWSPDGNLMVFSSERDGHFREDDGNTTTEIYVMDAAGKNQLKDSLTIALMTIHRHGHPMVIGLSSSLRGMGTGKSM